MAVDRVALQRLERLRAAPLAYEAPGATATTPPLGYRQVSASHTLKRRDFDAAVEDLLTWRVHQGAGLGVLASSVRAEEGAVVELRLGVGRAALRIPCRVIYVVAEPDRRGFAYGTLPGHPESGEELFLLQRQEGGRITFTITAFSRPARLLPRLGGPVTHWFQDVMTRRYLFTLDRLAG